MDRDRTAHISKRPAHVGRFHVKTLAPRVSVPRPPVAVGTKRKAGSGLQRERKRLMMINPLCVRCEERGIVRAWTQRDHIIPLADGGPDVPENTQGLCDECHAEKSNLEDKNRRGGWVQPKIASG